MASRASRPVSRPTQNNFTNDTPSSPLDHTNRDDDDTTMHGGEDTTEVPTSSKRNDFDDDRLSPLEREVLLEYRRLNDNLLTLSQSLATLSASPSSQIADSLRLLERKTALVDTALKSSVYSIILQQQMSEGVEGEGEDEGSFLGGR